MELELDFIAGTPNLIFPIEVISTAINPRKNFLHIYLSKNSPPPPFLLFLIHSSRPEDKGVADKPLLTLG